MRQRRSRRAADDQRAAPRSSGDRPCERVDEAATATRPIASTDSGRATTDAGQSPTASRRPTSMRHALDERGRRCRVAASRACVDRGVAAGRVVIDVAGEHELSTNGVARPSSVARRTGQAARTSQARLRHDRSQLDRGRGPLRATARRRVAGPPTTSSAARSGDATSACERRTRRAPPCPSAASTTATVPSTTLPADVPGRIPRDPSRQAGPHHGRHRRSPRPSPSSTPRPTG